MTTSKVDGLALQILPVAIYRVGHHFVALQKQLVAALPEVEPGQASLERLFGEEDWPSLLLYRRNRLLPCFFSNSHRAVEPWRVFINLASLLRKGSFQVEVSRTVESVSHWRDFSCRRGRYFY